MISPYTFEKMGDKEAHKSWKTSILCQGKTLKSLIEVRTLKRSNCTVSNVFHFQYLFSLLSFVTFPTLFIFLFRWKFWRYL